MIKGNWKIKILTLFMAAIALCMTASCGDVGIDENASTNEYVGNYEYVGANPGVERITPSEPCGDEDKAMPSDEKPMTWTERRLQREAAAKETYRIRKILDKYDDLIFRQSTVHGWSIGKLRHKNSVLIDQMFIEIEVDDYVDQSTLPPEDRIPECLEGIPVHFVITPRATIE